MKILITGFEPFGGEPHQPLVGGGPTPARQGRGRRDHQGADPHGVRPVRRRRPRRDRRARPGRRRQRRARPAAGSRSAPSASPSTSTTAASPTTTASSRSTHRSGTTGPPAYFSSLPVKAMVTAMRRGGHPGGGVQHGRHLRLQPHHVPGPLPDRSRVPRQARRLRPRALPPQQVVDKPTQPSLGIDEMATALEAGLAAIVEFTDKPDRAPGRRRHPLADSSTNVDERWAVVKQRADDACATG